MNKKEPDGSDVVENSQAEVHYMMEANVESELIIDNDMEQSSSTANLSTPNNQIHNTSFSVDGLAALQNYLADFSKELDVDERGNSGGFSATSADEAFPNLCRTDYSAADATIGQFVEEIQPKSAEIQSATGGHLIIVPQEENVKKPAISAAEKIGKSAADVLPVNNNNNNNNQQIILAVGGNNLVGPTQQQSILIPLPTNGVGSTILLPINSFVTSDGGVVELRLTPVLQNSSQQQPVFLVVNNLSSATTVSADSAAPKSGDNRKTMTNEKNLTPKKSIVVINNTTNDVVLSVDRENDAVAESSSASALPNNPNDEITSAALQSMQTKLAKGETFQCQFCDYTNAKRYLMLRHLKSHSEERPHKCPVCERRFKTPNSLQNHINTHTGVRPHQCRMCDASFTTSGEMVRHVRYKHTLEKPHKCPHCDYASVELSKLKRHMRSHSGERPYQCPSCEYASPDTYKLKRHMRVHTGEKPYECDVCLQRFTQSNSLKAHKLIHAGTKPVYQCEFCPSSCGRKTDLKIHVQKLHGPTEPLPCKKCDLTFPDRYSYKIHMKSHDGERFQCDLCDYASLSLRNLETHVSLHRGEKPSFNCLACDMTFLSSVSLRRHENSLHNPNYVAPQRKEKPFACAHCAKRFYLKTNLDKHLETRHNTESGNGWIPVKVEDGKQEAKNLDRTQTKLRMSRDDFDAEVESDGDDSDEFFAPVDDGRILLQRPLVSSTEGVDSAEFIINIKRTIDDDGGKTITTKKRKRIRLKPEQLGMTNLRKPGRPKNPPQTSSSAAVEKSPPLTGNEEKTKSKEDIENLFGFAPSTSDVNVLQSTTTTTTNFVDLDDSLSVETTLADERNVDESLEPLVINDNKVVVDSKNESSRFVGTAETIIFDLTSEERLEIMKLANTQTKI